MPCIVWTLVRHYCYVLASYPGPFEKFDFSNGPGYEASYVPDSGNVN